jgi:adenylate cyclase
MTYQSPTDDGASAASPVKAATVANGNSGALRTVLVCDVVDSVHWMQVNEAAAIAQWQDFIEAVKQRVIPKLGGRLVKSLGDGLMLEFLISPQDALNAAFVMKEIAADIRKADTSKQDNFWLRMALHHTTATVGEDDIYGHGVNLCARIATLAGPGEIVISTEMRDQLTDRLDADLEDMGECFLKHIEEPVRVYRAGPVGAEPVVTPLRDYVAPLHATVAVIPFVARSLAADNQLAVGEIIADGVIGQLSRTPNLKVISRLSTSVFRNRISLGGASDMADVEFHLGANYVLSGSYIAFDKKIIITAELSNAKSNEIVWTDRIQGDVYDLLQLQSELCHTIANATHMAILNTEALSALTRPLPTLDSYTLLLGGIAMMYRTSKSDFFKCRDLFAALMERNQANAMIPAWLAKWHVLQVVQGWAGNDAKSVALSAMQLANKSLNLQSNYSFALAIDGLVHYYLMNDFDAAFQQCESALKVNSNESLAWLYKGMLHAFKGEGDLAVHDTLRACELSPLDPNFHYYQSLTASAYLTAEQYEKSIEMAKRSLRGNAMHISTHRCLTIAQAMVGQLDDAQSSARHLMKLDPTLSIASYMSRIPGAQYGLGKKFAEALRIAGVPA